MQLGSANLELVPQLVFSWLVCCFTSTETVGLLGTGAQDGHLNFHTAPELCRFSQLRYLFIGNIDPAGCAQLCVCLYRQFQVDVTLYITAVWVVKWNMWQQCCRCVPVSVGLVLCLQC